MVACGTDLSSGHRPAEFIPVVPVYQTRNTVALPSYHPMDLAIVRSFEASWGSHDVNLSVYNLYNRRNPYFLYLDAEMKNLWRYGHTLEVPVKIRGRQVSTLTRGFR